MIFDGRWKLELNKLSMSIYVWNKFPFCSDWVEHKLNRSILYSATIIRKLIEDEEEAENIAKNSFLSFHSNTVHTMIKATKYAYTGEKGWTVRSKLCASDYGTGQDVYVKAKDVCNWLLHSYVWGLARSEDNKYEGFVVASDFDKEKFVHFVSFNEWRKLLKFVINRCIF